MAEAAHPTADRPKLPAEPSRRSHRQPEFTGGGYLAQLSDSIRQSPQAQQLRAMTEMTNPPAPVAQAKRGET